MKDELENYKGRVGRIPELPQEQRARLLELTRCEDHKARSELAEPFLKVVVAVAGECLRREAWRGLDERELIEHGNVVLLLALNRFAEQCEGDLDAYVEVALIADLDKFVQAHPRGA